MEARQKAELPQHLLPEFLPDLGRSLGQMIVEFTGQNHRSERAENVFTFVEVLTLDREHSLLQFEGESTVFDRDEIGALLVHPDP